MPCCAINTRSLFYCVQSEWVSFYILFFYTVLIYFFFVVVVFTVTLTPLCFVNDAYHSLKLCLATSKEI